MWQAHQEPLHPHTQIREAAMAASSCTRLLQGTGNTSGSTTSLSKLPWRIPCGGSSDGEGGTELRMSFLHLPGDPPFHWGNSLGAVRVNLWLYWNSAWLAHMSELVPMFKLPVPHFERRSCPRALVWGFLGLMQETWVWVLLWLFLFLGLQWVQNNWNISNPQPRAIVLSHLIS